jgi:hypothetical protein
VHNAHPLERLFKKLRILCVCKDSGELELLYTADGNVKFYTLFGKVLSPFTREYIHKGWWIC